MSNTVLGIETSCDETAVALVSSGEAILSSVVSSQIDLHAKFGGVVPEIASRAHLEILSCLVDQALGEAGQSVTNPDIECVAATVGPGLIGALLVGVSSAKALSLAWDVPFVAVNHLEAHLYASFLAGETMDFPMVVLLVSGGHTMLINMKGHSQYELLGQTHDDACGEAFDKVARYLGLGYPGGPIIDQVSSQGDPNAIIFPKPMINDGLDFSFSGLKTAVIKWAGKNPTTDAADIAASFQKSAVQVLVTKTARAIVETGVDRVCLAGGVAANSLLRSEMTKLCEDNGWNLFLPPRSLCTDNAAMVAASGWWKLKLSGPSDLATPAIPSLGFPATI